MLPILKKRMKVAAVKELATDHIINKLTENGLTFINSSASSIIDVLLPPATIDQCYRFRTTLNQRFRLLPEDGEDLQNISAAVLTDGYGVISTATGNDFVEVYCRTTGHWIVSQLFGTFASEKVVSNTAIAGVTAPVLDATPVATVTADDHWTGTVTWSPNVEETFKAATVYTATITLTPKLGYRLDGVTANQFTVAGADPVTNPVNSGVVTAVFPETAAE